MSARPPRTVLISEQLRDRLYARRGGTGSYDALLRDILARLDDLRLSIDDDLIERIEHYAFDYGRGSWQLLLRDLVAEIEDSCAARVIDLATNVVKQRDILRRRTAARTETARPARAQPDRSRDPGGDIFARMNTRPPRTVLISEQLRERLCTPSGSTGGYQVFVNQIVERLDGRSLSIDDALVERIEHYAFDYGRGPWQLLLRDLLAEIESSTARP